MMRSLSFGAGILGALFFVLAVAGRFHEQPSISLLGHRFQAQTFLIVANTFLVAAIYTYLLADRRGR
jgi:hypothetical protein